MFTGQYLALAEMNSKPDILTTYERMWLTNPKQYKNDLVWLLEERFAGCTLPHYVLCLDNKQSHNTTLPHVDIMWNDFDPLGTHNGTSMRVHPNYYGFGNYSLLSE